MLVLSRQRDESIIIGDNIVITVVDIRGDKRGWAFRRPPKFPYTARRCTRPSNEKTCERPGWIPRKRPPRPANSQIAAIRGRPLDRSFARNGQLVVCHKNKVSPAKDLVLIPISDKAASAAGRRDRLGGRAAQAHTPHSAHSTRIP